MDLSETNNNSKKYVYTSDVRCLRMICAWKEGMGDHDADALSGASGLHRVYWLLLWLLTDINKTLDIYSRDPW
jgi:hypothetical protein